MCAKYGKNIGTRDSCMSFEACESNHLMVSVTFEGFGIAGATRSKYCKSLLFRELFFFKFDKSQYHSYFKGTPSSLLYILYIIYIIIYQ
jgi:hypothetical protein